MFAKVFASLWDGTLADQWETWSTFVFMLAHCDADGVIDMTPQAISRRSCIPMDKVKAALEHLESPDPQSRTSELDGRRIERLDDHRDWGWRIVNYVSYRNMRDQEQRREQNRESQTRRRERVSTRQQPSAAVSTCQHVSATVSSRQQPSAQAEVEAEAEEDLEPAGSTLFAELETVVATCQDPATATRLVKYLRDSGTTHPGCILAVVNHWLANRHKIDKPLAYYDRNGPARSAIVMQHNMAIAEQRQERMKRMRA
jgi:hypothetical protein